MPSGSLTQTQFHKHLQDSLLTVKHSCSHHPYCCYVYTSCTSLLFILIFIKSQYTVFAHLICCALFILLHILLFISNFFTYIYALVLCYFYIICIFILLHCPLSGPDLIYISLLIIPYIIYYVTNKETLNLESSAPATQFLPLLRQRGD